MTGEALRSPHAILLWGLSRGGEGRAWLACGVYGRYEIRAFFFLSLYFQPLCTCFTCYTCIDMHLMVFVLQLWAYEVLGLHPPETTHPQANEVIPRALCWGDDFRQHSYPRVTLDTLRASLDRLSGGGVSLTLICTYKKVVCAFFYSR
jgi:hypothetical protein